MIIGVWGFFFWPTAIKRLGFNAMNHAQQVYLKVKITEILVVSEECFDLQSQG